MFLILFIIFLFTAIGFAHAGSGPYTTQLPSSYKLPSTFSLFFNNEKKLVQQLRKMLFWTCLLAMVMILSDLAGPAAVHWITDSLHPGAGSVDVFASECQVL